MWEIQGVEWVPGEKRVSECLVYNLCAYQMKHLRHAALKCHAPICPKKFGCICATKRGEMGYIYKPPPPALNRKGSSAY